MANKCGFYDEYRLFLFLFRRLCDILDLDWMIVLDYVAALHLFCFPELVWLP